MDDYREIKYPNGLVYFGPVNSQGKPHGFGEVKHPNGECHCTEFVNGVAHGDGKIEYPDGKQLFCTWVNGAVQGRVELYTPNGGHYEAYFRNNERITDFKPI